MVALQSLVGYVVELRAKETWYWERQGLPTDSKGQVVPA